ncbi:TetR/AcrR family transcriptional regulator [Bacillus luteolus]|uniref:TetR/AcrR family transcriptional regulator n=1 Tax=Litchfieldia luteola TaxID=682179 RepID=A0ABR9QQ00_9BACI|nr:TetR/AcrR family transcriptional regulator [Cytobacillus luteolus]MBE4910578.1 TetR/AcrR family transcriptional regulator [Cytobacillus luteolus]MBP1943755.1 AcrR family transcriptional regulator [Cytobacillus luteolus]
MKKKPEVTAQTKQNIIDAFWSLYCEKRIEKITVKEITLKAGYNRGTFYEYFTDIYDVLEQIEESLIPTLDELPPISIGNENMGIPIDMFMKLYEKNSKYYSVLLGDNGDPAFASKLKNSTKPILKQAFAEKYEVNQVEFDFILEYVLSVMVGIMSYWFRHDKAMTAEDLIALMQDLMENGVMEHLSK